MAVAGTDSKKRQESRRAKAVPSSTEDQSGTIRINVFLQEHGVASRRQSDVLVAGGHVKVNGKVVKTLGTRIDPDAVVTVDGKILRNEVPKITYLFHKPDMTLTSRRSEENMATIFELPSLKKLPANVQPVGRLDFRSEGLLLLTNDGDLAYALTHPRYSVEKAYACLLAEEVTIEDIEVLRAGVQLDDGLARAINVRRGYRELTGGTKRGRWIEMIVAEGRNRLVRRMLESLGHKVLRLVRISVGEVSLPEDLKPGSIRVVDEATSRYLQKLKDNLLSGAEKPKDHSVAKREKTAKSSGLRTRSSKPLTTEEYREKRSIETFVREKKRKERKPVDPSKSSTHQTAIKQKTTIKPRDESKSDDSVKPARRAPSRRVSK